MNKPTHKSAVVAVVATDETGGPDDSENHGRRREAPAGGHGHWMDYVFSDEPTVNDHELISLSALIAYVAHMNKQNEFRIERQFADRFNIPNVKCLPSERYDDAIRYLVDQVPLFASTAD